MNDWLNKFALRVWMIWWTTLLAYVILLWFILSSSHIIKPWIAMIICLRLSREKKIYIFEYRNQWHDTRSIFRLCCLWWPWHAYTIKCRDKKLFFRKISTFKIITNIPRKILWQGNEIFRNYKLITKNKDQNIR